MKSYTDLEQSKVLATTLPLKSADMHYKVMRSNNESILSLIPYTSLGVYKNNDFQYCIPCWSLAALISVLPNGYVIVKNYHGFYYVESRDHAKNTNIFENPVDACVAMIEELHKLKML